MIHHTLSQQDHGLMENTTHDPDFPDDPNVWMWPFDDDDASRNVTKKARQILFSVYLIPRLIVDNTFILSHKDGYNTCSSTHAHVASALSSVSPSPFAVPSRESASKSREETTHTTTINTADEGNHAPLSREDEDQADPTLGGDIEMCTVGPDVVETRVQ